MWGSVGRRSDDQPALLPLRSSFIIGLARAVNRGGAVWATNVQSGVASKFERYAAILAAPVPAGSQGYVRNPDGSHWANELHGARIDP